MSCLEALPRFIVTAQCLAEVKLCWPMPEEKP
jgi:hypothetical protein